MTEDEKREVLIRYISEGCTQREIAQRIGVSRRTIFNWLKQLNLTTKYKIGQKRFVQNNHYIQNNIGHIVVNSRTHGQKKIKVSPHHLDKLLKYKWHLLKDKTFYAGTDINNKTVRIHRLIGSWVYGNSKQYDHINHNTLDNRDENLRPVTQQQNSFNSSIQSNNTSGITGVSWHKQKEKYAAYIRIDYNLKHLGCFDDIENAKRVRKEAEIKYFGEHRYKGNEQSS